MFDPCLHVELDEPAAVVRHEVGHAAVWFHHGGAIGRLRLTRLVDGRLAAGVRLHGRTSKPPDVMAYFETCAERLLAGELAARRHVGLPTNRISVEDPSVLRGGPSAWSCLEVIWSFDRVDHDAARAVQIAAHEQQWLSWLERRLSAADHILAERWTSIDSVSAELLSSVPRRLGSSFRISGSLLIDLMRRHGLQPKLTEHAVAIEALTRKECETIWSWPGRIVRTMSTPRTVWRWVDDDEEPSVLVHPTHHL
jgi:hypothetical protein